MSVTKTNSILASNDALYDISVTSLNELDQSRLIVNLDQNIIDDINKQIDTKEKILDNDPLFAVVNGIFVNVIDVFYGLMNWISDPMNVSLMDIIFVGYRPISLLIFIVMCYYIVNLIIKIVNLNQLQ